ncbi:hypothetical protein [Streptomyces sp. R44]|uniref:DUF1963 domain-containing protein n=1 Tax=Streptomyces sp. R44 TaxID=3238633 RepID=A0AB39SY10_9ACTN
MDQQRRVRKAKNPDDPRADDHTPEELAIMERFNNPGWDEEETDHLVPMLPVAQLYARDVLLPHPPGGSKADLLQVLWCPFDHPEQEQWMPRTAVFWRSTADVTEILTSPPEPYAAEELYVPVPCVLAPEQVIEYPTPPDLSKELQEQLKDRSRWQAAGARIDAGFAPHLDSYYAGDLSVAPGWKTGGHPRWGYVDPWPRPCLSCGTDMDPLLTIASVEWDGGGQSWIPYEDETAAASPRNHVRDLARRPTAIQIADLHDQQIYYCPMDPGHPHRELMQ